MFGFSAWVTFAGLGFKLACAAFGVKCRQPKAVMIDPSSDSLGFAFIRMFSLIVLNTAHALIKISYKCTINGQILIFQ